VLREIHSYIPEDKKVFLNQVALQPVDTAGSVETSPVNLRVILDRVPIDDKLAAEKQFLDALCFKLEYSNFDLSHLTWNRLRDKTLNIKYKDWQIGRINLVSRKTKMQILADMNVLWIENQPLSVYLDEQSKWVEYLNALSAYHTK